MVIRTASSHRDRVALHVVQLVLERLLGRLANACELCVGVGQQGGAHVVEGLRGLRHGGVVGLRVQVCIGGAVG